MKYTIGQAAKLTGKAKSTLSRDVKDGRISAAKNEDGSYSIDASELQRVYGDELQRNGCENTKSNSAQPLNSSDGTGGLQTEIERLRERLSLLDLERDRERRQLADQIEDLKQERRRWQQEADSWRHQATALLTDQRPPSSLDPTPPPGWLRRLFGVRSRGQSYRFSLASLAGKSNSSRSSSRINS
jgi:hypothetical protein